MWHHSPRHVVLAHSVTTPYNADFDGDEMNMHVAQVPLGHNRKKRAKLGDHTYLAIEWDL
jgi:hypothetical protein